VAVVWLFAVAAAGSEVATPDRAEAFSFVAMGDNRPHGDSDRITQPPHFVRAIDEINLLDPDFVVICGDLIYGYTSDEKLLHRMWDDYDAAIAEFEVPAYPVIGNHDVSNEVMQRVYLERYGDQYPLFYSFDYKGCHFIAVNSDLHGEYNTVTGEQLQWLEQDLESHRDAARTFVFLHKPLWRFGSDSNWMSDVHPLLAKHQVHTVFAGHTHVYTKCNEIDGVRYIITGGAGAEIGRNEVAGELYHYCLVTVRGDDVSMAVIRTGYVENEDVVTEEVARKAGALEAELRSARLRVPRSSGALPAETSVAVRNPFEEPLTGTLVWDVPEGSPVDIQEREMAIAVEPGQTRIVTVNLADAVPLTELREGTPLPVGRWTLSVGNRVLLNDSEARLVPDRWPYTVVRGPLRQAALMREVEPLVADMQLRTTLRLPVPNPSDWDMEYAMQWQFAQDCRWTVTPESQTVRLAAGKDGAAEFEVAFEGEPAEVFPFPRLESLVKLGGEKVLETSARLPVQAKALLAKATYVADCVRTETAPKVDGRLDEQLWGECPAASNFVRLQADGRSDYQTEARFACDGENLYVGLRCHEPNLAGLQVKVAERDGPTWSDDCVELFLDTNLDRKTYYHYAINAAGFVYDGYGFDSTWDGPCRVEAGREENAWVVEMAVPWQTLEMEPPKSGTTLGLEIVRARIQGGREVSQWAPTLNKSNHTPERFGVLVIQ